MMQSAMRRENSMKAIDFMGGDWVLINGIPRKVQAVDGVDNEIMADDELYTLAEDRYHSEDKVEGVLITPEILEKNGFRHGSYVGGYYSPDCPFRVFVKTDGRCEFTTLFDDEIHFSCTFVHELQHALRLCGINKEIEL